MLETIASPTFFAPESTLDQVFCCTCFWQLIVSSGGTVVHWAVDATWCSGILSTLVEMSRLHTIETETPANCTTSLTIRNSCVCREVSLDTYNRLLNTGIFTLFKHLLPATASQYHLTKTSVSKSWFLFLSAMFYSCYGLLSSRNRQDAHVKKGQKGHPWNSFVFGHDPVRNSMSWKPHHPRIPPIQETISFIGQQGGLNGIPRKTSSPSSSRRCQ